MRCKRERSRISIWALNGRKRCRGSPARAASPTRSLNSTLIPILLLVDHSALTMSTPFQDQPQNAPYYAATPTPSAPSPHPQSTPDFTQPGPSTTQPSRPATGQAAEEARKDKTLAEFLLMLDEYEPLVRTTSNDEGSNAGAAFALGARALMRGRTDTQRSYGVLSPASRIRVRGRQTVSTAVPLATRPCSSRHHIWLCKRSQQAAPITRRAEVRIGHRCGRISACANTRERRGGPFSRHPARRDCICSGEREPYSLPIARGADSGGGGVDTG